MKLTIAGLWHLGCVTAACCARHFVVTGVDRDAAVVARLNAGNAPVFEPGLDDLIGDGIRSGRLKFNTDQEESCRDADVLWVNYDTPVSDADEADVDSVIGEVRACVPHLPSRAVVLISSQVPVGTCARLEREFPGRLFAYSAENLQLGKALAAFERADRIVVGIRNDASREILEQLLTPFCQRILWMRTESAEMVKHGLNAFLAVSISFINEVATLCEKTGADAQEVSQGLKSDVRIGPKSYLSPGSAFAGGTLARDVVTLTHVADKLGERLEVIPAIKRSNDWHRTWAFRRLQERLGELAGRRVALLGLVYKPNTDTLRRSQAIELALALKAHGAEVRAYDPAVRSLPLQLEGLLYLSAGVVEAIEGCDAVVIGTEWPIFREEAWEILIRRLRRPLVLDPNRFLEKAIGSLKLEYLSVGRAS